MKTFLTFKTGTKHTVAEEMVPSRKAHFGRDPDKMTYIEMLKHTVIYIEAVQDKLAVEKKLFQPDLRVR